MSHDPSGAVMGGIFSVFFLVWLGAIILGIASMVFWIVEIVDVARREFRDQNTKILWLLVVILTHGIGALIYYFVGKPQGWLPGQPPLSPPIGQQPGVWPPPPGGY